jgi:hypothetical protein
MSAVVTAAAARVFVELPSNAAHLAPLAGRGQQPLTENKNSAR